jgi:dCTP deaminase
MILSNTEIIRCLKKNVFSITPHPGYEAHKAPFNTSAIDLHLSNEIVVPDKGVSFQIDLRNGGVAKLWQKHSSEKTITADQPYSLAPNTFVLAKTLESVAFPLRPKGKISYAARVEGRSSLARCGILVHFTAPTIHAGFEGTVTLEIINLGTAKFLLFPEMAVCQLIVEEVRGNPADAPNQFKGQSRAVGKT